MWCGGMHDRTPKVKSEGLEDEYVTRGHEGIAETHIHTPLFVCMQAILLRRGILEIESV